MVRTMLEEHEHVHPWLRSHNYKIYHPQEMGEDSIRVSC